MIKAVQIFYNQEQRSYLSPLVAHWDNSKAVNEPCLENHVIAKLIDRNFHDECDYFGVFSWAFERKRAVKIETLWQMIEADTDEVDVYAFDRMHTKLNMWQKAEQWHPGILKVTRSVFNEMRIAPDFDTIQTPNIYSNAFLARPFIYDYYVTEWLKPFMKILIDEQDAMIDTGYKRKDLDAEHLMKTTGFPYFTLMPFVCERLFATFLAYNPKLKLKHIA